MDILNQQAMQALLKIHQTPCISIYMPTHQKGMEVDQDPIRFKNLLKTVENDLKQTGFQDLEIKKLLKPANDVLNNSYFWRYQSDGLVVYISPDTFQQYRVPISFNEHAVVADRFYIKPLIPLMTGDVCYYLLSLNLNDVKLYQVSNFSLNEIQSEAIPKNIEEILKYDDPEKQIQFHTGSGAPQGRRPAMFHGQGVGKNGNFKKNNILRYFQAVDKGVQNELAGKNSPLLLVGVEYLNSTYKEVNSYPHLFDKTVDSNPVHLNPTELHQIAWEKIKPYFQKEQNEALSEYPLQLSNGKASEDVAEIVKAASHDRIKYLFINLQVSLYGKYDPDQDKVEIHEPSQAESEDLVELATRQTILLGGKVYALEPEKMPNQVPLAAIFRF